MQNLGSRLPFARDSVKDGGRERRRVERRHRTASNVAVRIELAQTQAELEAAYRLVHSRYASYGLQSQTAGDARFIPHCCLASTCTFIARVADTVIATVSLIVDGPLGLPMDQAYSSELDALRARGAVLAEASCLASRRRGDAAVLLGLYRMLYAVARYRKQVSDLCITVHPRQRAFYEKALLFSQIGPTRPYPACNGAPGIAMGLDVNRAETRHGKVHGSGMLGRAYLNRRDCSVLATRLLLPGGMQRMERYRYARAQPEWRGLPVELRRCIAQSYS